MDSSTSTRGDGNDPETLACAAQISPSSSSCGKGKAETSPQSLKRKSLQIIQKREILNGGETLALLDVERALQHFSLY